MDKSLFLDQENAKNKETIKPKPQIYPLLLSLLGLSLAGIAVSSKYFLSTSQDRTILLSGRIEADETDIGTKVGGRVNFVAVQEGKEVNKDQNIVRLDDQEIKAKLKGATARLVSAQQQELQARLQINLVESQILEVQLNLKKAQEDTRGQVLQAEASVAANVAQLNEAFAKLEEAQSQLNLAKVNRDRFAQLVEQGAVSKQQFDQAQTTFKKAQATVKASQASVNAIGKLVNVAQGQLVQAQTSTLNPEIINAQLSRLQTQLAQARLQLAMVKAEVEIAKAFQQEIKSKITDLEIASPIDGVVITRLVEPGEIVSAGQTLLTVIDPNNVYLRGYVPAGDIGKIRVGQKAKVFLDSDPDQPLSATVTTIDTQASFTPENIYFREDRVRQVFGIKLTIDNPGGLAKPGMPADAEIITELKAN
ncbi:MULTISPECIES: HlyD family efflux transporter periplasmic adaptor subunit [unclassified Moorena]|uniref:HlyD family secretion protein n=1 Tax=unclassified Moorena TaxID=2683338 RepID=UPI0013B7A3B1|nr:MULTISPECIES: HlyD family efflux transporter periplasmic adaptor subunit [unclassified Moorena]NEP35949.1 HlyD family efflux transporter periplasmic adaptor subunit [Moorena sp. SIO3B2]NEQ07649.1 HlyD family efflux transporter periplasmic adaptor subunit [Moorena sp. SIO4E2]